MPASPEAALQSMIENLAAKTGKSLADWVAVVKKSRLEKHGEVVGMLKQDHGIGHGYANLIAHQAKGSDAGSVAKGGGDLVAEQYAGAKAGLRPRGGSPPWRDCTPSIGSRPSAPLASRL